MSAFELFKDTVHKCAINAFRHQIIQMSENGIDTHDRQNAKLALFTYHTIMKLAYLKQKLEKSIAEINQTVAEGSVKNFTI